jgi:8-oxo-dGTP diphosphatase
MFAKIKSLISRSIGWLLSLIGLSFTSSRAVIATADSVIFAKFKSTHKVLLIRRGKSPYQGMWAFPGGRIEPRDADIRTAACRELWEETGLHDIDLRYFTTVGNSTRDPRGFCLTSVFTAYLSEIPSDVRVGDDAVAYCWFGTDDLPAMAFDHRQILNDIMISNI